MPSYHRRLARLAQALRDDYSLYIRPFFLFEDITGAVSITYGEIVSMLLDKFWIEN